MGAVSPITPPAPPTQPPKLLDRVRHALRVRHYSLRTEEAYVSWIKRYLYFHHIRHPNEMGAAEINAFLTDLAVNGHVAASTQNQAFSALLFLYRTVLEVDPGRIAGVIRAHRPKRLPVVLTRDEIDPVLAELEDPYRLIAQLLYGSGLRLLEALRLRVQDVDFARREILVRHGKGGKDRRTMLPVTLGPALPAHLEGVRQFHQQELAQGRGQVRLPEAFERKVPAATTDWRWQWVFPSSTILHAGRMDTFRGAYTNPKRKRGNPLCPSLALSEVAPFFKRFSHEIRRLFPKHVLKLTPIGWGHPKKPKKNAKLVPKKAQLQNLRFGLVSELTAWSISPSIPDRAGAGGIISTKARFPARSARLAAAPASANARPPTASATRLPRTC